MIANDARFPRGITLVETMTACTILLIGAFGVFMYKYTSALDAARGKSYISASRIAWLLIESWRGNEGSSAYDPVSQLGSTVTISANAFGPSVPAGFTKLGQYKIVENNVNYFVTMSWQTVPAVPGLSCLNVIVAWSGRTSGTATVYADASETFQLTTYADTN